MGSRQSSAPRHARDRDARSWTRAVASDRSLYTLLLPNAYGEDHISHYAGHSLHEELAEAGFGIVRYRYMLGGELIVECMKREQAPELGSPDSSPIASSGAPVS